MNVTVNKTISYAVQGVKITNVMLNKDPSGGLLVMVPFSWEDDTGTTIRADAKRYAQAELTAAFQAQGQDFAPISVALLALVPTEGTSGNCVLFVDDMSAMQGYSGIVDNKPKWISTQLTNAQVTTIIAPVTTDQLNAMITSFVIAVTS